MHLTVASHLLRLLLVIKGQKYEKGAVTLAKDIMLE